MVKRTNAVLLAAVMLMGVLFVSPVMATEGNDGNLLTNPGLETIVDGKPDGYAVTKEGDTAAFDLEDDTTKTHGGSAALVLSGSAAADTVTVEKTATLPAGRLDVTAFMNLTAFTDGSGVKLELLSADGATVHATTDWFVKTAYNSGTPMDWRKMMVCYTNAAEAELIIRVTFAGAGSVTLDDFGAVIATEYVRNGDFEGFAGDYKPAGFWYPAEPVWGEGQFASIMMEDNGNHYLFLGGNNGNGKVYYMLGRYIDAYVLNLGGQRCTLKFDYMGNVFGTYASIGADAPGIVYGENKAIGGTGPEWRRGYSMHYAVPATFNNLSLNFGIVSANNTGKIDNISHEPVKNETLTIMETGETVTANFVAYGTDYSLANIRTATVILARYRVSEGNVLSLDGIETGNGTAKKVTIVNARYDGNNPIDVGETPLRALATLDKPTDGAKYVYKAFAWDDIGSLRPQITSEKLTLN